MDREHRAHARELSGAFRADRSNEVVDNSVRWRNAHRRIAPVQSVVAYLGDLGGWCFSTKIANLVK